jgi:Luciferase
MAKQRSPSERITAEVASWPGVVAGPGSRREFAFKVAGREIGHLHGDHVAHFGFPKDVWQALFDEGRIGYHPVFPGRPGFGARTIESAADVEDVIALMRLNYDRVVARHGLQSSARATA